ncbi:hypothetical protein BaRGS_00008291, partial [Batillaria attramentaria]
MPQTHAEFTANRTLAKPSSFASSSSKAHGRVGGKYHNCRRELSTQNFFRASSPFDCGLLLQHLTASCPCQTFSRPLQSALETVPCLAA